MLACYQYDKIGNDYYVNVGMTIVNGENGNYQALGVGIYAPIPQLQDLRIPRAYTAEGGYGSSC